MFLVLETFKTLRETLHVSATTKIFLNLLQKVLLPGKQSFASGEANFASATTFSEEGKQGTVDVY